MALSKPAHHAPKTAAPTGRAGRAAFLSRRELVHELQAHQVELEQLNEQLLRAQRELAAARDRFVDLFDCAPVGYLTLDRRGRIQEANLTAAAEFGIDRPALLGRLFTELVAPADGDRWQRMAAAALRRDSQQPIELMLLRPDGCQLQAHLECRCLVRAGARAQLRITLSDVSLRQLAERNRRIASSGSTARESECRAVAHRLHEDLGQRLGAIKMRLASVALPAHAASNRALLEAVTAEIDQALVLVRRISADLHPLMLDNLGLSAALEWLTRDVATRLGLRAELHALADDAMVDEPMAIAVYRLTETALAHFARHVVAGVSIELLQRPGDWVLVFQCLPGHARHGSPEAPLLDMPEAFKDRVHLLGGRLEFSGGAGEVCKVFVFINSPGQGAPALAPDAAAG